MTSQETTDRTPDTTDKTLNQSVFCGPWQTYLPAETRRTCTVPVVGSEVRDKIASPPFGSVEFRTEWDIIDTTTTVITD